MADAVITESDVRMFVMDKPELNPLLQGVMWSPAEVEKATEMAVDAYNSLPPFETTQRTVRDFPSKTILMMGTVGWLFRSASLNQAVNQFNYAADGLTVADHDKAQLFQQIGNEYWAEFRQLSQTMKIQNNVARAYGTIGSEFA